MEKFDFDKNLFRLLEEEHVSFYLGKPYWNGDSYEVQKRVIHYDDKLLVFTLPGRRVCQNGIRGNGYKFISISFSLPTDSNFFILSDDVLNEIKLIYPNIQSNYIQKTTIKVVVVPEITKFHRNYAVVEQPLDKTKFVIDSMRIRFSQVRLKYCNDVLQSTELELLAYEIYLA